MRDGGEELRAGQLRQLLEPYRPDSAEVWAVVPASPRPSGAGDRGPSGSVAWSYRL